MILTFRKKMRIYSLTRSVIKCEVLSPKQPKTITAVIRLLIPKGDVTTHLRETRSYPFSVTSINLPST